MKKLIALIFVIAVQAHSGTVAGVVQTSSSGVVPNAQFTFTLTQAATVAGTATVVTSPSYCWTDTTGNVRGLPGDTAIGAPVLTQNLGAGTLPAGTYYVKYTWSNASGETQPSVERIFVLGGIGTLIVTIPTNPAVPPLATLANIYISTTSGSYATGKQGTIAVTNGVLAGNFQQSTTLAVGAAIPSTNSSACSLRFNDELTPSYTGYNATLANVNGAQIAGFPQKWYLAGGASGTVNLSNGTPLYSGIVVYPQAIVTTPPGNALQSIAGPLTMAGAMNSCVSNGVYIAGSSCYPTVQNAITAACNVGGGAVFLPAGIYPQNTSFTLCSNLIVAGSGRAIGNSGPCPTAITTTMISGDLFPITNMTDIHLSDFCIINNAAAGANAAIRLNYGQFSVFDRLWISGLFAVGIELDTSSTSGGSTIRNTFRDVFITSLAPNGIGCLLNSSDATSKVINNNAFWMVACQGGSSNGVGLKVTNSNTTQNINENFFYGDEFATTGGSLGTGIGIQFTTGATRGMTFIGANVESNGTGLNKANQNTVSFLGGNFSSNGTNVIDSQQAFSQFIGTNVGGTVQQFAVDPGGGIDVNCIGVNASCVGQTNILNVGSGFQLTVATAAQAFLDTTGFRLRSVTFANLPAATNGTEIFCSDCNATCAAGASTGRTCFRENGAWTH